MKPTFKQVTKTRYVQLVSELAQEIFVQHYTKLTPKVAAALAEQLPERCASPDEEIHSGVINYFLVYLGSEPVGYFALDLGPAGALCLRRLFLHGEGPRARASAAAWWPTPRNWRKGTAGAACTCRCGPGT